MYHKWREKKQEMYLLTPHSQLCSPPSLQELKVEEILHEFPYWRVTHYVWLIYWGGRDSKWDDESQFTSALMLQKDLQVAHCCFHRYFTVTNVSYLDSLHTWEEKLEDILMMQHLDPWENSSYEVLQGRRGFSLVLSLQLLEDKQHLGGEDCNVPKFAHSNLEH